MSAKHIIHSQTYILTKEEFSDILFVYPVSFEYKVMLPKRTQTIFDAPDGYPIYVRTFPDSILFLAGLKTSWKHGQQRPAIFDGGKEIAFKNFMFAEDHKDLSFLPKKPSSGFGTGSLSVSINTELPLMESEPSNEANTEPIMENVVDSGGSPVRQEKLVIHLGNVAVRIKDQKCKTRGSSNLSVKRMLLQGGSPVRQEKLVIHLGNVAVRIKDQKCKTRGSSNPSVKRMLLQGVSLASLGALENLLNQQHSP
nr:hypothetical protein [Tanacetum cinerariifolium]